MALSPSPVAAIASYTIFSLAASVFLSLHTGQTLWALPKPRHRGRDLGIFNLTNTAPSLAMPWLVLWLVPVFGFPALLAALSLCACLATILLWRIRSSSRV
jgi:cobalamin synthase